MAVRKLDYESGEFHVFVPVRGGIIAYPHIKPGSGIVGRYQFDQGEAWSVTVYYEGNLYGASNLNTYEERLRCAADRFMFGYPTAAKMHLPAALAQLETELVEVGWYDYSVGLLFIDDEYRDVWREWVLRWKPGR